VVFIRGIRGNLSPKSPHLISKLILLLGLITANKGFFNATDLFLIVKVAVICPGNKFNYFLKPLKSVEFIQFVNNIPL
jgi:hypothetical protein